MEGNATRSARAAELVTLYRDRYDYTEDAETALCDLLADLRHWADREHVSYHEADRRAGLHHHAETHGEE